MKKFCIILSAILVLVSCGQRNGKTTKVSEPVLIENGYSDSLAAISRLLEQEDSIAVIENAAIEAKATITAKDLLALRPVHSLESDSDIIMRVIVAPDKGLRLANRFMRMYYASGIAPEGELVWVDAVQKMFTDYCRKHKCTEEQAWADFMEGIDFLACGTQPEINRYCYVTASMEYYRTLAAYKSFLDAVKDAGLLTVLLEEYRAWNEMNGWRQSAFVHIRMAGQHYSALPMDYEGNFAAQAICRRELLETEKRIILGDASYNLQHEVITTADWNEYLEQRLYYRPEAVEATEGDVSGASDQKIVSNLDSSVKEWLAARHAVTKHLREPKATYYDNLTADYHWVITNEAEVVPEGYD